MRAILIDSEKKTLSEVQISKDYRDIQKILQCRYFTTGAWLSGSISRLLKKSFCELVGV